MPPAVDHALGAIIHARLRAHNQTYGLANASALGEAGSLAECT